MLEVQDTRHLSKTYPVYQGRSCLDGLAAVARDGGVKAPRNKVNRFSKKGLMSQVSPFLPHSPAPNEKRLSLPKPKAGEQKDLPCVP